MIARLEAFMLRTLRVPPEPTAPAGAPGSLRVFRAGRNYIRLKLVAWSGAQLVAIWGILISLTFIREVEYQLEVDAALAAEAAARVETQGAAVESSPQLIETAPGVYVTAEREAAPTETEIRRGLMGDRRERGNMLHRVIDHFVPFPVYEFAKHMPASVLFWIKIGEAIGLVVFAVQFFWSLGAVWLDYRQRWYMVTDRSLRLRWGVVKIQETTMSFANLQQVSVKQGPLQRLLKLADVEVQSAGGGAGGEHGGEKDSMHRSTFHAVENASEIRDLILARLRRFRQSGLGEPDDDNTVGAVAHETMTAGAHVAGAEPARGESALAAAQALVAEVRAWRETLR